MNKERRKRLNEIESKLTDLMEEIESIKCEEDDAFYNLPESIQKSERGEAMEEASAYLDDVINYISEAIDAIETAAE